MLARMTPDAPPDCLIAGAGLNGLTAALALGDAGAKVVVVDPASRERLTDPDYDWRTTAIAQGAIRILRRLGAWDEAWAAGAIREIRIVDGDSPLFLHYDGAELAEGDLGCIVPNAALRVRLFETAEAHDRIAFRLGGGIDGLSPDADRITIALDDGESLPTRLLVGADGRRSSVRRLLGVGERTHDYGQTSIVATAAHERPHRATAHERFLPGGPFAILPLPDDQDENGRTRHRSSIVWTEATDVAERLLALERPAFDEELALRFGDQFGAVKTIGPIGSFPIKLVEADRITASRAALIGDAARAIHPIAGQGFNLGLRDSAELARLVGEQLAIGLDPGAPDLLKRYASARAIDSAGLIAATHGINGMFSNDFAPLGHARRLGLAAVQATPPLKRRFMRHAMGLAGRAATLAGKQ